MIQKTTQILIEKDYDHTEEMFQIDIKFWSESINGYMIATPKWKEEFKEDRDRMFEKFKDIEYTIKFGNGLLAKLNHEPELEAE